VEARLTDPRCAKAVAEHKKSARLGMLWREVRWPVLGMTVLVMFECLGRQWGRATIVGGAALVLAALFSWLVNASDLQWHTIGYTTYRSLHEVPPHVSAAADVLLSYGVSPQWIGVEYLKNDPILFVEDAEQHSGVKRYDLVVW
jgi:hypothetical protein